MKSDTSLSLPQLSHEPWGLLLLRVLYILELGVFRLDFHVAASEEGSFISSFPRLVVTMIYTLVLAG